MSKDLWKICIEEACTTSQLGRMEKEIMVYLL
jgi:hypothetical protein